MSLLLSARGSFSTPAGSTGGGVGMDTDACRALREDHAVVAVTIDGRVHTLDAWTGRVRGVFEDSGGALVSTSTKIDATVPGRGSSSGMEEDEGDDADGSGSGTGEGRGSSHRNAFGEGYIIPGLDGVIYSLSADGRLSVLMSSAPDLVFGPRMACLAVSEDSDGIVKDESCVLLLGGKTTELFALDTETGTARRVGDGGGGRKAREQDGVSREQEGGRSEGQEWTSWEGPNRPGRADGRRSHQLLLSRDEYLVRAWDVDMSEELWFVTLAHFSALDLEGGGGSRGMGRASVDAAAHETASPWSQKGRPRMHEHEGAQEVVEALPVPEALAVVDDDRACTWNCGYGGWDEKGGQDESSADAGGKGHLTAEACAGDEGSRWGLPRRSDRRGMFGEAYAGRFPYLMYEENTWIVAFDPLDGSVLWRREMPALAVSLYGIRGHEWVDIIPPPMSLRQHPGEPGDGLGAVSYVSLPGAGIEGEEVAWSMDSRRSLMLAAGGSRDGDLDGADHDDDHDDDDAYDNHAAPLKALPVARAVEARDDTVGDSFPVGQGRLGGGGSFSPEEESISLAVVSAPPSRVEGPKASSIVQPGLRQGQLHAQLGLLNSHLFVSSVLRRTPMHAAAAAAEEEANAGAYQERYAHPIGVTARRSFVEAVAGDPRGSGPMAAAFADDDPTLPPPVAKLPSHAARPPDQPPVASLGTASTAQATKKAEDRVGIAGAIGGVAGRVGIGRRGGMKAGMGEWGQALLDRLERDMLDAKTVGVEVHPDKKGLYMSWRFIAWMVGLVTMILTVVAYVAYNYGVEAMVNMSNITRSGSISVRLNRLNTMARSASTAYAGRLERRVVEPVPPEPAGRQPQHQMRPVEPGLPLENGGRASSEKGDVSGEGRPADLLRERRRRPSRDVHIQRVHSLPALGETHSPATPRDRGKMWKSLFGPETRAAIDRSLSRSRSVDPGEAAESKEVAAEGNGGERGGTDVEEEADDLEDVGLGLGEREGDSAPDDQGPPSHPAEGVHRARGDAAERPTGSSGSGTPSYSSSIPSSASSRRRGSDRESAGTETDTGSGTTGSSSDRWSGNERRRRRRRHDRREEWGQPVGSGSEGGGSDDGRGRGVGSDGRGGERARERGREKRSSRSPRVGGADQALVVRGAAAEAGGVELDTGGDAPGALLVANRRLRTEFIEGSKLGRGGFGTVYKCRNRLDGHDYAVKKIRLSSDARWRQQLAKVLREVKILALLDHPNIVRYYQVRTFPSDGGTWICCSWELVRPAVELDA